MGFLKRIWKTAPIATTVLAVALIVLGVFAVRLADDVFAPDPPKDVAIEDWMTPKMVSHSWKIPRREMFEILGFNDDDGRRRNIRQLAADMGIPPEQLIAQIEAGIADYRAEKDLKDSDND